MDEGCSDHQIFGITISLIVQRCINKVIVENLDRAIYCPYTHTKDGKRSYNGHWRFASQLVQNRGKVHT
jgi:plasmid replication initiation protein